MFRWRPDVAKLEARRDLGGLIRALEHKDREVARTAAEALGRTRDPGAVEALVAALHHPDERVSEAAARALSGSRDARAVEPLIALLEHARYDLCAAAARALGETRDARAVEPLIAAFKRCCGRPASLAPVARPSCLKAIVEALCQLDDARAVRPLADWLRDAGNPDRWLTRYDRGEVAVLEAAEKAVLALCDPRAPEPVTELLEHRDAGLRARAAKWLGHIQGPKALEALLTALQDKELKVREAAMSSLGHFREPRAVEPLLAAVKNRYHPLRRVAAQALETMKWKPAADEAGAHYWTLRGKWNECVRIGAAAVLPLTAELAAEEWAVREAAAGAMGEIGDPRAVEPLLAAIRDAEKAYVGMEQYLGEEDTLAAYMNDESPGHSTYRASMADREKVRWEMGEARRFVAAALLALGRIGDSRAAEPVQAALAHPDPTVRAAAAEALQRLQERGGGPA